MSTIVRVWEEFGVERAYVVYGRGDPSGVRDQLHQVLRGDVQVEFVRAGEPRPRSLHDLLARLAREYGVDGVVVSPTPCSRGLACALGLAASGRLGSGVREPLTVVHIDYY